MGAAQGSSRRAATTRRTAGAWSNGDTTPATSEQTETLFALSNGFLGIRASFEEGEPSYRPATLLNGFHETWPIAYPETAHGFATTGQTILPVPDGTTIRLLVDEDPVTCDDDRGARPTNGSSTCNVASSHRTVTYQLADGRRFRVDTRFVSLAQRHLACIRYEVTALDSPGRLRHLVGARHTS